MASENAMENVEDKVVKSELNINDIKINFLFTLEDKDGEQVKVQNGMIFKAALEPGVITSVAKRVESTLSAIGEDYFLLLFRDYLNIKMNNIYKAQVMQNNPTVVAIEDSKYVADGVTEVIPENIETDEIKNEEAESKPILNIE